MTSERPQSLEDNLEAVQALLGAAARYAESAHRKLDQVATQQQVNTDTIAHLATNIDQLSTKVDQLTDAQGRTQSQLDQLSVRLIQLSERVDVFVSTAQHYFGKHGESIEQLKGISERTEGLLAYLIRKDQK